MQDICLKGHIFFLYLSHFLLQDSCEFPSNFLVQYRAELPIEFTLSAIHVALAFPGITHMMNYLDFLWQARSQGGSLGAEEPPSRPQFVKKVHYFV